MTRKRVIFRNFTAFNSEIYFKIFSQIASVKALDARPGRFGINVAILLRGLLYLGFGNLAPFKNFCFSGQQTSERLDVLVLARPFDSMSTKLFKTRIPSPQFVYSAASPPPKGHAQSADDNKNLDDYVAQRFKLLSK
jgi:hypothetical protein